MVTYKNQHYVPQFYLRYFSNGDYICSYNIKTKKCNMMNCKNVCSKDYFYSRVPEMERVFSMVEAESNRIITKIRNCNNISAISKQDYCTLLYFIVFQYSRTLKIKQESQQHFDGMADYIVKSFVQRNADKFAEDGINTDDFKKCKVVINGPVHAFAIKYFLEKGPFLIKDLSPSLLLNRTRRDLIISDSPIVLYNSFFNNSEGHFLYPYCSTTGLQSPGLQIFCPLGPKHMLVLYDREFYRFEDTLNNIVGTDDENDIDALNILQLFNCSNNVLFRDPLQKENIRELHTIYEEKIKEDIHHIEPMLGEDTRNHNRETILNYKDDINYTLVLSFMKFNPFAKAIDVARDWSTIDFVEHYFTEEENDTDKLFYPGEIIVGPGADKIFLERPKEGLTDILGRHVNGDWGEVCQEEKEQNDNALQNGSKIISAYTLSNKKKIFVVTEAEDNLGHRKVTRVLAPEEFGLYI